MSAELKNLSKMKYSIMLLLLPMAFFASEPVPWQDIAKLGVLGELGKPLGHIVEVEAVVVSGRDLYPVYRDPVRHSSYFLRVSTIAGKELPDSILIRYFSSSKRLPDSLGGFAKMKDEVLTPFSPADIKRLEAGIVGQRFRMLVMEEAVLKGNPTNLSALPERTNSDPPPYDEPVTFWQDYWGRFGYHHYILVLEVLGTVEEPNQEPQRNAGNHPSSADSSASATPSSPAPRG